MKALLALLSRSAGYQRLCSSISEDLRSASVKQLALVVTRTACKTAPEGGCCADSHVAREGSSGS
jgi:hypothetical protein